jgi:hypothetical protein
MPNERDTAPVGHRQTKTKPQRGCFASTIGSQQAKALAPLKRKRNAIDHCVPGIPITIRLVKIFDGENSHSVIRMNIRLPTIA